MRRCRRVQKRRAIGKAFAGAVWRSNRGELNDCMNCKKGKDPKYVNPGIIHHQNTPKTIRNK
eukprot:6357429-Amphidinium_carterae.1